MFGRREALPPIRIHQHFSVTTLWRRRFAALAAFVARLRVWPSIFRCALLPSRYQPPPCPLPSIASQSAWHWKGCSRSSLVTGFRASGGRVFDRRPRLHSFVTRLAASVRTPSSAYHPASLRPRWAVSCRRRMPSRLVGLGGSATRSATGRAPSLILLDRRHTRPGGSGSPGSRGRRARGMLRWCALALVLRRCFPSRQYPLTSPALSRYDLGAFRFGPRAILRPRSFTWPAIRILADSVPLARSPSTRQRVVVLLQLWTGISGTFWCRAGRGGGPARYQ